MRVCIIVDTGNRNSIMQIGFETKAAAEHYIKIHGNPKWKAEWMTVYSDREVKELWPD